MKHSRLLVLLALIAGSNAYADNGDEADRLHVEIYKLGPAALDVIHRETKKLLYPADPVARQNLLNKLAEVSKGIDNNTLKPSKGNIAMYADWAQQAHANPDLIVKLQQQGDLPRLIGKAYWDAWTEYKARQ